MVNQLFFLAATGIALLPAIGLGVFLAWQMVKSRTAFEQSNRHLIRASAIAIAATLLIVCGEAAFYLVTKNSSESASGSSDLDSEQKAALAALERQDFNSALEHVNEALKRNSRRLDLLSTRALIYVSCGKLDTALKELDAILKENPAEPGALLARSKACFLQGNYDMCVADASRLLIDSKHRSAAETMLSRVKFVKKDYAGALAGFERAIKSDPDNLEAFEGAGDCRYNQGAYQAALHQYDSALKPDCISAERLFKRGRCLYGLGKYQEAFDDLAEAVKGRPANTEYRRTFALACFKLDKLPSALDELDQALHQDPYDEDTLTVVHMVAEKLTAESEAQLKTNTKDAQAHAMLAYAMYMLRSYEAALKEMATAISLAPNNARNYFLAGECAIEAKQEKRAVAFFERALQLEPKNINARFEMARAQSSMDSFQESIRNYTRFLAESPDSSKAPAYIARGICCVNLRDFANAINDFTSSLKYVPGNAETYALRGDAYGCLGDKVRAMEDLKTALSMDPGRDLCHRLFTNELLREGRFPEALTAARKAVAIRPGDPSMHSLLSQVFWLIGDYQQALNEINVAVELAPNTARIKSQQAAIFWALGRDDDLRSACDFLRSGTEGKDNGQAFADVYFSGLWPYIFYSSLNDRQSAEAVLTAAFARLDGQVWPNPIFRYLQHKLSAADLLMVRADLWSQTEVRCYLGCSQFYAGEKEQARQNLKWVVDKGRKDFFEYMLAQGLVRKNKW